MRRGLHVSEYGILDDATGETLRCATEEAVYARSGWPGSRPSCARGAASSRRRPPATLPELVEPPTTCAATCTATRRSPTGATGRADGRGARASAASSTSRHRPLGVARLRQPRHGRRPAARRSSEVRAARRASSTASAAHRLGGQHPAGRLARLPRRPAGRARLGHRLACTRPSGWTERMTDAHGRGHRAPVGSTPSATPPGARSSRARPTRSTSTACSRPPRAPARCSRSTPRPTAATSTTSTRAPPPRPACWILIDTDAHAPKPRPPGYGVATARRAWLTAEQVANTRPWAELQALRKPGRAKV